MKVDLKTVQDIDNPLIKKCPYCGGETFFVNYRVSGKIVEYNHYDGEGDYQNIEMHDGVITKSIGKFAYCADCKEKVFRFEK